MPSRPGAFHPEPLTDPDMFIMLGSAVATAPFAARAEQPERTRRIGVLMLYPESDPQGQLRQGISPRVRDARLDGRRESSDQSSLGHGRRRLGAIRRRGGAG